ncbi:hypothetical protein GCM10008955_30650 [Deinococcus malanensis]|uniref:DUF4397 domain-containing protein n=1 Tax=Deinococcus malanensis TaxID=1706855 RepID=A0ABQ2F246_9DEIO|nr:DUF4397 domain-containing protein [Deinococcus malanensis]GGK34503.1 hypothetical protein GCM10008955_30650 [Deinococcus malanensis]
MQNRKSMKATMIASLFVAALSAPASASWVYFHNDSGASGPVDVWVNGVLMFTNIPPDNHMMFPKTMPAGMHEVVVTPHKVASSVKTLARKTVEVQYADAYTLKLGMNDGTFNPTNVAINLDIRSHHFGDSLR